MLPSKELEPQPNLERSAWILGVLCGGGSIKDGNITLTSSDQKFIDHFHAHFSSHYDTLPKPIQIIHRENRNNQYQFNAYNKNITDKLGDLRKNEWFNTIVKNHLWVLQDQIYIISFLSGYFDNNGSFSEKPVVSLSISNPQGALILEKMLACLGIEDLSYKYDRDNQIRAIQVFKQFEIASLVSQFAFVPFSYKKDLLENFYHTLDSENHYDEMVLAAYEIGLYLKANGWKANEIFLLLSSKGYDITFSRLWEWLAVRKNPYHRKAESTSLIEITHKVFETQLSQYTYIKSKYYNLGKKLIHNIQQELTPLSIGKQIEEIILTLLICRSLEKLRPRIRKKNFRQFLSVKIEKIHTANSLSSMRFHRNDLKKALQRYLVIDFKSHSQKKSTSMTNGM